MCPAFRGHIAPDHFRKTSPDLASAEASGPIRPAPADEASAKECVNHNHVIANLLAFSYANLHEIETRGNRGSAAEASFCPEKTTTHGRRDRSARRCSSESGRAHLSR